jgi:hypothetical protein
MIKRENLLKKTTIKNNKRNIKLIDYTLAESWLKAIDIKSDPFNDKNDVKRIIDECNRSKENIGRLTLERLNDGDENLKEIIQRITKYLGHEDKLEKSDFIFVFGGRKVGRINKAIELWKAGMAPKIWISGGHPIYKKYEPEALTFKRMAIDAGVPAECIFTEQDSITIADNCRRSLNLMERKNVDFEKMILIITWYAQKRAWMTMEKYLPVGKKLFNSNALLEEESDVSPTKWYESDYGINVVFNEFLKMRVHDSLVMSRLV